MGRIRVGVGGWTYEPWRGSFDPAGLPHSRELEHASRARTWAGGGRPEGLDYLADAGPKAPRDVFLYVISGFKALNPRAAMALGRRLG